ncbi:hypothetical protein B0H17DRAFT_1141832 [Mycena rosella]|uniref:Uncharacterized protein n=1 Tax=Mycena rosella TaxID=1033263 RepID=A0AAD7G5S1_MYCRO|nr:hypothetical protein B0H17DRAFT_1141832 [Mycena rosella]
MSVIADQSPALSGAAPTWLKTLKFRPLRCFLPQNVRSPFTDNVEEALGRTFVIISKVWEDFDFFTPRSAEEGVKWLGCTNWVAVRAQYSVFLEDGKHETEQISPKFNTAFTVPLGNSLLLAAAVASSAEGAGMYPEGLETISKILTEVGNKIMDDRREHRDCWDLRYQLDEDLQGLESSLGKKFDVTSRLEYSKSSDSRCQATATVSQRETADIRPDENLMKCFRIIRNNRETTQVIRLIYAKFGNSQRGRAALSRLAVTFVKEVGLTGVAGPASRGISVGHLREVGVNLGGIRGQVCACVLGLEGTASATGYGCGG